MCGRLDGGQSRLAAGIADAGDRKCSLALGGTLLLTTKKTNWQKLPYTGLHNKIQHNLNPSKACYSDHKLVPCSSFYTCDHP